MDQTEKIITASTDYLQSVANRDPITKLSELIDKITNGFNNILYQSNLDQMTKAQVSDSYSKAISSLFARTPLEKLLLMDTPVLLSEELKALVTQGSELPNRIERSGGVSPS